MDIFNYDSETGEFTLTTQANKSPLEKNKFLIPANATSKPLPVLVENEIAVFNEAGDEWIINQDFRSKTYYLIEDGKEVTFVLGEAPDATMQSTFPKAVLDVLQAEALAIEEERAIASALTLKKATRDNALNNLTHNFVDGRIIQVRKKDESNIRNAIEIMARENVPAIDWIMLDNKKYSVTPLDLQTALESGQMQSLTIYNDFNP